MQMDYLLTGKAQSSIFYTSCKCHISLNVTEVLGEQQARSSIYHIAGKTTWIASLNDMKAGNGAFLPVLQYLWKLWKS